MTEKSGSRWNATVAVASAIWFAEYGTDFSEVDEEQQESYYIMANAAIIALDLYRANDVCDVMK